MQRLAGSRQCAWRCESRSLPNASPQRHNTQTQTIFYSHMQAHTACCCCFLLIHSSSSSTIYFGLCRCSRSNRPQFCVPLQLHAVAGRVWFLFQPQRCRSALFKDLVQWEQIIWPKKRKKKMSVLVHTLRPSLSSWSQCVWGKQSVRFDFLTT